MPFLFDFPRKGREGALLYCCIGNMVLTEEFHVYIYSRSYVSAIFPKGTTPRDTSASQSSAPKRGINSNPFFTER